MLGKLAPLTAMKSAAKVLVCLVAGALVVAGPASAQTTRHVRYVFPLSETFTNAFLSDQCGFEVVTSLTGNANVSLVYNNSGLIAREVDTTSSGSKTIFSAPSTGQSFSHPDTLVFHFDYGAGATIGSAVTIRLTGLFGHAPGFVASDGGIDMFSNGVVEGFDEFGLPQVDFGDLTLSHGNRVPTDQVLTAICASLSGP